MEEIKYIEPAALHDEMLRLRNEKTDGLPRKPNGYGLGSGRRR